MNPPLLDIASLFLYPIQVKKKKAPFKRKRLYIGPVKEPNDIVTMFFTSKGFLSTSK